ncbi:Glycine cleavage system H protein [bacterium HR08]|nr:Glycine cleavage system H protein [bacterium HR08]
MVALFVILTIIGFILVDSVVQWAEARQGRTARLPALRPTLAFETTSIPAGLFLDEGHTWVRLEPSGRTFIGMDEFARRAIGRVDAVELPKVGATVRRGDPLFAITQEGRRAVFRAPLDGVVTAVNETLTRHPEAGRLDPYEDGWVCTLMPKNLAAHLRHLFVAEEAQAWLRCEIERFKEFLTWRPVPPAALGHVLQDGGQWTDGVLEALDEASWEEFTRTFLRSPRPAER